MIEWSSNPLSATFRKKLEVDASYLADALTRGKLNAEAANALALKLNRLREILRVGLHPEAQS